MRIQHLITIALILALAGLLVWVSGRYTWEADWTYGNRNSLIAASKRVLDAMPGEIAVTAYAYPGPGRQSIRDAVDRYRRYDDSVRLTFVDPAKNPQKMRELGIRRDGALRIGYEGRHETLDALSEQEITSALQRLSSAGEQWVVFLSGHGERDPQDDQQGGYSDLRGTLDRQGLRVRGLNLAESPQIPENTAVLVIASPQRDFLPGEISMIRDYVDGGGNLLWLSDPSGGHGLDAVAEQLGIAWLPGTAIYPDYRRLGTGDPAIALALSYPRHPITRELSGITLFPHAGGMKTSENPGGWQAEPLIRTPERSWLETGTLDAERIAYEEDSGDTAGPITIGMALTRPQPATGSSENGGAAKGEDGKAAPAPAGDTGTDGQGKSDTPGEQRVAVIGDSDFLTNANINAVSNRQLGVGLLQWLGYRDRQISVDVPAAPDDSLQLAPWQGRGIWLAFVIVLPLLLLAAGIGRWWLRRRR